MARRAGSIQLPLDLGHAPGLSRDDLIVSAANAEAVAYIERWPDWSTPVTILAGPPGSGKSHVAAVWRSISGASRADGARISRFDGAPVLLEDADAGDLDQTGLFHLINAARAASSFVLITARQFPTAWGVTLPDLASRLKAAATVEIHEPDDELLAGVIAKLFADRQVEVEPHVVQYLARRIERSLATAIMIVERLDQVALQQKSRITRALAAEVVSAFDEGQGELAV